MPKKIIQKTFSKIIFLIFIFTIFSTFINKQKTSAFSVDTNTCAFTSTSSTSTVVSTADLTGTLPLCFYDVNNGDRLTLFKDDDTVGNNKICFSNTKTGDNWNWANTAGNTSNCTTGGATSTTFPAGSAGTPNRINFPLSFTPAEQTNGRWYKEQKFYIKDSSSVAINAEYKLTLLPATIGMTASTSVTGHNVTGNKYGSEVWSNAPYLKYGDNIDITCTNSTAFEVQENNTESSADLTTSDGKYYAGDTPSISWSTISSSTKDYNGSVPLTQVPTIANNYTLKSSFSYDWARPFKYYYFNCQNIGGSTNRTGKLFLSPKKFTISYRNWIPNINTTANNTPIPSASIIGATAQGTEIWDGQSITAPTASTTTGYKFEGWYSNSALTNSFTFTDYNCGASCANNAPVIIYAKWVCDVNYQNDGNGNCVESPCGVTTLSSATTNGTPCVVDLRVGVYSFSPSNLLYGRNANGVDDSRITNAELVIDQNTSPKTPIQLKYNQYISVYCGKTSNFLLQWRQDDWTYIRNENREYSTYSIPNSYSSFIGFDYGTSSTNYNYACQNIGHPTTTKTIAIRTPKKFYLNYINKAPNNNALFDNQNKWDTANNTDNQSQGSILWDGETIVGNLLSATPTPTTNLYGWQFGGWYSDAALTTPFTCFSNNSCWTNNDNDGTINIYAKWTELSCGINAVPTGGIACNTDLKVTFDNPFNGPYLNNVLGQFGNKYTLPPPNPRRAFYLVCAKSTWFKLEKIVNNSTTTLEESTGSSFYSWNAPYAPYLEYGLNPLNYTESDIDYILTCKNIGAPTTTQVFKFKTPKRYYISYRNPAGSSNIDDKIATSSLEGVSRQGGLVWEGDYITAPTNLIADVSIVSGKLFKGWFTNSSLDTAFTFGNYTCGSSICTNGAPITIYAKWSQETNINATTTYPGTPCFRGVTFTSTTYPSCSTLSSASPYIDGNATTTSLYTCKVDGSGWSETSSSTDYSGCYKSCSTDGKKYLYGTTGFKGCPSAPQNISCDWTDGTYTKYNLSTTDEKMCKDSSNNNVSTYLISTRNSSQATNTNYHIATSTTNPTYQQLFINGSFDASKYINSNTGTYNNSLSIACPTLLNAYGIPLLKDLSCGNNPKPRFTLLDVSAKNVKAGTGINIFWSIANPNTSCNIEAKKISDGTLISSFASSSGSNLYANITGTSTILSLSQILGLKTNSSDGSKTITSNYATNTKSFFTINESTRFIGYCKWQGATTTPIIRDVYVSGGGEN